MLVGDSKSAIAYNIWPTTLALALVQSLRITEYAISGYTLAQMETYVNTNLDAETRTPDTVLINLGTNDFVDAGFSADEVGRKASLTAIIDAIRAKWSGVRVYVAKPWRRTYGAAADLLAGWIDNVVATYATGVAVGHDERVWLEGGDDGATMTTDGVHYSAAGNTEAAAKWAALLSP